MPHALDDTSRQPPRPPVPLAAAVMLGLVLGIFGYILFFALAFARPADDLVVFLPILALAPIAGALARFAWPHWLAVAACVAMPTVFWSLLAYAADRADGSSGAARSLAVAAAAAACASVGALVGRSIAARRLLKIRRPVG